MSSKKGVAGWITYYFEYDKLAEYTGKLAFTLGLLLYASSAIIPFMFDNATITSAIGKATLYMIATLCAILIAYLVPVEPVKKTTTPRRSKTPRGSLRGSRAIAVITLVFISLLCYMVLCVS